MYFKNHNTLLFYAVIIGLLFNGAVCFGQKIKLDDVVKIKLVTMGEILSDDYKSVEVIPEKDGWNSYQTKIKSSNLKTITRFSDSSKLYIRRVPPEILNQLLTIIARQDTGINFKLFKTDIEGLIKYADTINPHLKPQQKAEFVNALRSKKNVQEALIKVLETLVPQETTYYGIIITTKSNLTITVDAANAGGMYKMPWNINTIKSYDPNIALIFEFISGDNQYKAYEQSWLYKNLDRRIYWKYFQTRFSWDDFKIEQPASVALLKGTLTPAYFAGDENWANIMFRSSQLPQYVEIGTSFKKGDMVAISRYKRYEDTLVNIFKKNNFLFDYLKARPGCIVYLSPGEMTTRGKYIFKQIKQYYPAIDSVDYKQTQFLDVRESNGMQSRWLVLPDNKVILGLLTGPAKNGNNVKFMDLQLQVRVMASKQFYKRVCVVFDSTGKMISYNADAVIGLD